MRHTAGAWGERPGGYAAPWSPREERPARREGYPGGYAARRRRHGRGPLRFRRMCGVPGQLHRRPLRFRRICGVLGQLHRRPLRFRRICGIPGQLRFRRMRGIPGQLRFRRMRGIPGQLRRGPLRFRRICGVPKTVPPRAAPLQADARRTGAAPP